jgi:hypothetical protein
MRGESQLRAKHAFERKAGWRYGFVFGVLFVFFTYAWDAFQLYNWGVEYWWIKLALACVTILPLALLTGGIGGYVNWLIKLPLWGLFGVLAAYCAIHIPFDGARIALQNLDPILQIVEYLPIPEAASDSFGMMATLGALLGIIVGLLQTVLVNSAWERTTEDYRMTLVGAAFFFLTFPIALAFAVLFDGTAHLPMRLPVERINAIVESGLHAPPNQDHAAMEYHEALVYMTGQQWAKNFVPDYKMRLASVEATRLGESYVDVSFANGFNWRCRLSSFGEFAVGCTDLNSEYARYISEFIPRGSFRCADCQARVTQQALDWRGANARELTSTDRVQIVHNAGSSITIRVQSQDANSFECLIWGANPVIVQKCENF